MSEYSRAEIPEQTREESDAIAYIRSPAAIRERCRYMLELAQQDRLLHFSYVPEKLSEVVAYVTDVILETYPTLDIPFHSRWRHFNVGQVDRVAQLKERLGACDAVERGRCAVDLVITSVLLDAGAGEDWCYDEAATNQTYARSEGLAVASIIMLFDGLFSSHEGSPLQADAIGLQRVTDTRLAEAFQVTPANPLVGLSGRAALLRKLGDVVQSTPRYFGTKTPRPGNLYDNFCAHATHGVIQAQHILLVILDSLGSIWPGRLSLGGVNLGDVWRHSRVPGAGLTAGLVPFHKLSQWLTYSLIEPLEEAGLTVEGIDELTGLAEYRNGGLLVDLGLLMPKHGEVLGQEHTPDSEVVVEWRALTVALLDCLADQIRTTLGCSSQELPLVKILEGGTWRAGRKIAREHRADASPPIRIASDGTVF
jgi:hypothetical protein